MTEPSFSGQQSTAPTLVDLRGVHQVYHRDGNEAKADLVVLDDVSLHVHEGEIVGLLGRSGSGKSTLLRIIDGLLAPTAGEVHWRGQPVTGPVDGIAMVFQNFALFPWLTVLQNVLIGLEAINVPHAEARQRALQAIDLIGLDGFENAYPRELSGGMRQRVGFARALVVHPLLMLMDEPFSALDVLTAETLRTDIISLWSEGKLPIRSILIVTHNIEEAVLMCNRVMVLSSNPGHIATEIAIDLPYPRERLDPEFRALVDRIYAIMTNRPTPLTRTSTEGGIGGSGIALALREVSTNRLAGLIEWLAAPPWNGRADLPQITEALQLPTAELFATLDTLQLLRLAELHEGDAQLTDAGRQFATLSVDARKRLFCEHLMAYVPLAERIRRVLDERPSHSAPFARFSEELQDHMADEQAQETLRAVIGWGRYAEAFDYDEQTGLLNLENPV